jgi:hypothetical protein
MALIGAGSMKSRFGDVRQVVGHASYSELRKCEAKLHTHRLGFVYAISVKETHILLFARYRRFCGSSATRAICHVPPYSSVIFPREQSFGHAERIQRSSLYNELTILCSLWAGERRRREVPERPFLRRARDLGENGFN